MLRILHLLLCLQLAQLLDGYQQATADLRELRAQEVALKALVLPSSHSAYIEGCLALQDGCPYQAVVEWNVGLGIALLGLVDVVDGCQGLCDMLSSQYDVLLL